MFAFGFDVSFLLCYKPFKMFINNDIYIYIYKRNIFSIPLCSLYTYDIYIYTPILHVDFQFKDINVDVCMFFMYKHLYGLQAELA